MLFFVACLITCFAIYFARVAKEEMVRIFAAIVALLSVVMSLALAPWFVQLSILILVVIWRYPLVR